MKNKSLYLLVFKLRTEAYTYSLTISLICPHNVLKNLAKVENSYSGQTLTRFQAASQLANAPWRRQQPDNSPLKNVWLRTTISLKPSTFFDELPKLEQFVMVLYVILNFSSVVQVCPFLFNKSKKLAPTGFNYAKRNSVSVSSFEAFSGSQACS